nr:hypothetical protein [Streptomyces spiramenti]
MPSGRELAAVDDLDLAVRLLAHTPTHEGRDPDLLRRWARAADSFGATLPATECRAKVEERDDGLDQGLLARYRSRPTPTVELYTDTLAAAERLVQRYRWQHWYPPGSLRVAVLAHEAVHERLHHGPERDAFRRALGHEVLRLGRLRRLGHVAGADEVAAHSHARRVAGLGRSPLLLTAALADAVNHREK